MTTVTAWAIIQNGEMTTAGGVLRIFTTKRRAKLGKYLAGDAVVRVRIEEIPSQCRSGCAMIDDVPVFCRRHSQEGKATQ